MLLHDSNTFSVILQTVVYTHCKLKCTSCILYYKCISVMAESDKRLISDVNQTNRIRDPRNLNTTPSTFGLSRPESQAHHLCVNETQLQKKKPTSFQITSVTVQGSRLSTDGGDDSADDLDESHTEDLSSDILDCSRTTDIDNDQLSEDNSNANNDYVTNSSISIPLTCRSDCQIKTDAPSISVNIPSDCVIVSESGSVDKNLDNVTKEPSSEESVKTSIPDQWQHRFKVVKIISSQPFKRGRWLCMDFMDPPAAQSSETKSEVVESLGAVSVGLEGTERSADSVTSSNLPVNRLAHVYEIPPNESYPGTVSVTVSPQQIHQPLYGIYLPLNNQTPEAVPGTTAFAQDLRLGTTQKPETTPPVQQPLTFISQAGPSSGFTTANVQQSFAKTFDDKSVQQTNFTSQSLQPQVMPSVSVQQPLATQHVSSTSLSVPQQPQASTVAATENVIMQASGSATVCEPKPVIQDSQLSLSHSQSSVQTTLALPAHNSQVLPQYSAAPTSTVPSLIASSSQANLTQMPSNFVTNTASQVQQTVGVPLSHTSISQASSSVQASTLTNIPDSASVHFVANKEVYNVPSQVSQNHIDGSEHGATCMTNSQPLLEVLPDALASKNIISSEDSESASGGSNTVAIDNKIEQAMDLVKSHLMFAVREEVDVLKEKITELMERISQLEYENNFLKANASPETLDQLNQSQHLQHQQQIHTSVAPVNLLQPQVPLQQNVTNQQSTS